MKRDWLQPGTEPSVAELLDDPTTRAIMRHDGLRAEHIRKVVEKAKRKLVLRLAACDRAKREQPNSRSIWDDPAFQTAADLSLIGWLGEWPDVSGFRALQWHERGSRRAWSCCSAAGANDDFGQQEPAAMGRQMKPGASFHGRAKPFFGVREYKAGSSKRFARGIPAFKTGWETDPSATPSGVDLGPA